MSSQIDKDREEAEKMACVLAEHGGDKDFGHSAFVSEISRIRAQAKTEERQRAAERICAIHCGSNENQTPTRWDGKCLYFDTCTYVSTILADDEEKV